MYVYLGIVGVYCIKKIEVQEDSKKIAMMGMGALCLFHRGLLISSKLSTPLITPQRRSSIREERRIFLK
ncbi:hypothetical protein CQA62_03400 [Helicobacter cholecystus]|uniref:Uncharacterized protein n=1 Tax=Helicobacter cholecystus TaxID=45498 RepID=A0A3D8IXA9_9HELI|nr:hypothetical protein CQA62_03400 [Helicobacter cholecystus]